MIDLAKAAPFVREHRGQVFVIKVGGGVLAEPAVRRALAAEIALVELLGSRVVVVHGSGPQTDALQRKLGEEPRKLGGRRVTSPLALRALRQATVGELNGDFAAALGSAGVRALGVAAGTAGILVAKKRGTVVLESGVVDFGEVGDITAVDPAPLCALLEAGVVPVLSPPASDGHAGFLNVNADVAAAHVAAALGAAKLILLTSAPGVLVDPSDPESLASTLSLEELGELEGRGALQDGMCVKAAAVRTALEGGVERVHVVSGLSAGALLGELYTTSGTGTLITGAVSAAEEAAV